MPVRDPAARRLADRLPVLSYLFDLLYVDGESLLQLPYTQRRNHLEDLKLETAVWRVRPASRARLGRDGRQRRARPGGHHRQAPRVDLPARSAVPGLAQGQAPADAGGHHRRMAPQQRTTRQQDRVTHPRRPRPTRPAPARRRRQHPLHRTRSTTSPPSWHPSGRTPPRSRLHSRAPTPGTPSGSARTVGEVAYTE
jgi:hypothetical protein